jgi:methionyl-tRNA formyltransferase
MMTGRARVVFFGTPEFAVPTLTALVEAGYDVAAVVTQPDRPVGRKRVETPPPVKRVAQELGLRVMQPERVRRAEAIDAIAELAPDVCITAAYGQILPQRLLDVPAHGCLNVHASLLPRWRGAAPLQRAILAGDRETGVTIMEMVAALDAGPMVAQRATPIDVNDDLGTLEERVARMGAELLLEVLPEYLAGRLTAKPQPDEGVTYAERIVREDEILHWHRPAWQVHNQIRALSPWPGASTSWNGRQLKVWGSRWPMRPATPGDAEVGTVRSDEGEVLVRCEDGWLTLTRVQPAGKRQMDAAAWLRGVPGGATRLGEAASHE